MPKVAFWHTIWDSYVFLFSHAVAFVTILAPWFGCIVVLLFVLAMLGGAVAFILILVGFVVFIIGAGIRFNVAWTRAILLDEEPEPTRFFGGREWRYLGYTLVISLAIIVGVGSAAATVPLVAVPLVRATGAVGWLAYALPLALAIASAWAGARLSLALPAVAVDETAGILRRAWHRAKGNAGRLFWGSLVAAVPFAVAQNLVEAAIGLPFQRGDTPLHGFGPAIVGSALLFCQSAVVAGFLALAYRQLTVTNQPA